MIKGIIFDLDGVLLDSMIIWKDLGARYLQSMGIEPEEGLGDVLFSMSMEQGADYLKKRYSLKETQSEILDGISKALESFYYNEVQIKPGVRELLEYMKEKGIRMVAATSSPRLHVEKALERNGISEYIERIFTNSEIGVSKHFPDIYNAAAEYMGSKPQETLVFEDSLYALNTANSAGYITVGVCDENGEPDQEGVKMTGDCYITSINEFILIFENRYIR